MVENEKILLMIILASSSTGFLAVTGLLKKKNEKNNNNYGTLQWVYNNLLLGQNSMWTIICLCCNVDFHVVSHANHASAYWLLIDENGLLTTMLHYYWNTSLRQHL